MFTLHLFNVWCLTWTSPPEIFEPQWLANICFSLVCEQAPPLSKKHCTHLPPSGKPSMYLDSSLTARRNCSETRLVAQGLVKSNPRQQIRRRTDDAKCVVCVIIQSSPDASLHPSVCVDASVGVRQEKGQLRIFFFPSILSWFCEMGGKKLSSPELERPHQRSVVLARGLG